MKDSFRFSILGIVSLIALFLAQPLAAREKDREVRNNLEFGLNAGLAFPIGRFGNPQSQYEGCSLPDSIKKGTGFRSTLYLEPWVGYYISKSFFVEAGVGWLVTHDESLNNKSETIRPQNLYSDPISPYIFLLNPYFEIGYEHNLKQDLSFIIKIRGGLSFLKYETYTYVPLTPIPYIKSEHKSSKVFSLGGSFGVKYSLIGPVNLNLQASPLYIFEDYEHTGYSVAYGCYPVNPTSSRPFFLNITAGISINIAYKKISKR